jgi:hypothetical protein
MAALDLVFRQNAIAKIAELLYLPQWIWAGIG